MTDNKLSIQIIRPDRVDILLGKPINGYSTSNVYRDDEVYISFGSGRTRQNESFEIIVLELCFFKWKITITDPETVLSIRNENDKSIWAEIALNFLFQSMTFQQFAELIQIVRELAYEDGLKKGHNDLVENFKLLMMTRM